MTAADLVLHERNSKFLPEDFHSLQISYIVGALLISIPRSFIS